MGRKASWPPPIYRRDGREYVRLRVGGQVVDRTLGPEGSEEARAEYLRLVSLVETTPLAVLGPAAGLSIAGMVAAWVEREGPRASERERENYSRSVQPLLRLYGSTSAAEFGVVELEAVQRAMSAGSWMSAEERQQLGGKAVKSVGWARGVVNQRIGRIRTLFRWAERQRLVPEGKWGHLCTLPGLRRNDPTVRQTKRRTAADWNQVETVWPHCPPPVGAMLRLQYLAGMRSCEVRVMRTCDLERGGDVWIYRPWRHKNEWRDGEIPRAIPLNQECQQILSAWLRDDEPEAYLFSPRRAEQERMSRLRAERQSRVQPSQRQRATHDRLGQLADHYSDSVYPRAVRRACQLAGVPPFSPYQLRHGRKREITRTQGLDAARAFLGQTSLGATNLYAHEQDLDLATETARRLEAGREK